MPCIIQPSNRFKHFSVSNENINFQKSCWYKQYVQFYLLPEYDCCHRVPALDSVLSSFHLQNVLPSHVCLDLPSGVFPWGFKPIFCMHSCFCHVCCMPCPYIHLNLIIVRTLDVYKLWSSSLHEMHNATGHGRSWMISEKRTTGCRRTLTMMHVWWAGGTMGTRSQAWPTEQHWWITTPGIIATLPWWVSSSSSGVDSAGMHSLCL